MEQPILIFVKFTLSVTTKKTHFVSDENIVKSDVNDLNPNQVKYISYWSDMENNYHYNIIHYKQNQVLLKSDHYND